MARLRAAQAAVASSRASQGPTLGTSASTSRARSGQPGGRWQQHRPHQHQPLHRPQCQLGVGPCGAALQAPWMPPAPAPRPAPTIWPGRWRERRLQVRLPAGVKADAAAIGAWLPLRTSRAGAQRGWRGCGGLGGARKRHALICRWRPDLTGWLATSPYSIHQAAGLLRPVANLPVPGCTRASLLVGGHGLRGASFRYLQATSSCQHDTASSISTSGNLPWPEWGGNHGCAQWVNVARAIVSFKRETWC